MEIKSEADRNKLVTDIKQKWSAAETKLHQEQLKLKGHLEDTRNKTEELELKLEAEKKSIKVKKDQWKTYEIP